MQANGIPEPQSMVTLSLEGASEQGAETAAEKQATEASSLSERLLAAGAQDPAD